jgi:L-2-hydroxyglutarate oxidase
LKKIGIVGGGILGLSIAYKLAISNKYIVHVFEKEGKIGKHQSGNNSGVLHCGLSYSPGSLKAKLSVDGINEMISFCKNHDIDHDICGKVVVATNDIEIKSLESLAKRGELNGLKGLKFLNKGELKKREPNLNSLKTLLVPGEGIVDFHQVMNKLAELIKNKGGFIHLNSQIRKIICSNKSLTIISDKTEQNFDKIINCTGLFSDRIYTSITNKKSPLKIIPFRGEYMKIKKQHADIFNHLVYPVPSPEYPFLGVHFTRMINGDKEIGPNAVFAFKREGYKNTDISIYDTFDSFFYKGFLNFLRNNFYFAMGEFSSSIFLSSFVKKAKKLIPDINASMLENGNSGVRAQAIEPTGKLIMDFRIITHNNQIHILNAPSPGATACFSIANYIINKHLN